jgi:hypothetical protein
LNSSDEPNLTQKEVMDFYPAEGDYFLKVDGYYSFNPEVIHTAILSKEISEEQP